MYFAQPEGQSAKGGEAPREKPPVHMERIESRPPGEQERAVIVRLGGRSAAYSDA